jgi:MerR family transcriptional regulator, copper efflux regulator
MKLRMSIGKLAESAGVGVETIRFYERERLLPPPERSPGNYRQYGEDALGRLNFILNAKNLGFTLDEIRLLLRTSENPHSDAGDFHEIAKKKIDWIEERIEKLREMRETLAGAVAACPGHGAGKSKCPVLALLTGGACHEAQSCTCEKCHRVAK